MKNCPEQIELYAFVDGELPRGQWQAIDDHLPRCSHCRDQIRGIARLNRELHVPSSISLPEDFEQSFRTALLARTVTSSEAQTFRRILHTKRLVYAAAGFVLAIFCWQFVGTPHWQSPSRPEIKTLAKTMTPRQPSSANLAFDQLLNSSLAAKMSPRKEAVAEVESQYSSQGQSMVGHIASLLERASARQEKLLYAILAMTNSRQSRSLLTRRLRLHPPRSAMHREILAAILAFPTEETARLIGRESRRGLSFEDAFQLLCKLPPHYRWPQLKALCQRNLQASTQKVVHLLADMNDERAEEFLLDLHFSGVQSSGLTAHLVSKDKVIEKSRAIVSTPESSTNLKRRAMGLLAAKGDLANAPILSNLVHDPKVGSEAVLALAHMGVEDAMIKVIRRLPLYDDRPRTLKQRRELGQIEATISGMGSKGLALVTRLLHDKGPAHRCHYLAALGLLGGEESLGLIYSLAKQSDLKETALKAVLRISSPSSKLFLKSMARDNNRKIRRLAIRGLKKIKALPARKPWRGFACLPWTPCQNSSRMV